MSQTPQEVQRIAGQVLARAMNDDAFGEQLRADARNVLAENGLELPDTLQVEVLSSYDEIPTENRDPNTMYLVLDASGGQLSHEELSGLAGGGSCQGLSTAGSIGSCVSTLQPDGSPLG